MWGCGKSVNGTMMSCSSRHKVLYVAVHIGFLDLRFYFRPFDSHYEVHRRYCIAPEKSSFLSNQRSVMSVDPQSNVTDLLLGSVLRPASKRTNQKRGTLLKPRIIDALQKPYVNGSIEQIKYIGFDEKENQKRGTLLKPRIIDALQKPYVNGSIEQIKYIGFDEKENEDICLYFEDAFAMKQGTKDSHFLLDFMQLSRTQTSVSEVSVNLDGLTTTLKVNRSYCSSGEKRDVAILYLLSMQRVNGCSEHKAVSLILLGPCNYHLAYVYPCYTMDADGSYV